MVDAIPARVWLVAQTHPGMTSTIYPTR